MRVDALSAPNTLTNNSDAASATLGCSRNSGVVTGETPRRTTRDTLSSDPKSSLAAVRAFKAARRVASRPSSTLNSPPAFRLWMSLLVCAANRGINRYGIHVVQVVTHHL